ncbi:Cro/C1-type HTH DNA-binding domain-containing protein [Terribacillus saccharophilus]|uniref:Cro/C1-type HTH DNA-binding domain-containing protein n=1 Tax=Terribacillus saccharophilus TaxID=361277 RepID=A0AAX2EJQ6_9BACI|nr:Cro/C1-type HTH DNA-binding domain-containing protein [Terribacillus saccharophilus]
MPDIEPKYRLVVTPRLQELLKEQGYSQTEIARKTGIDQSIISRFDQQSRHADVVLFKLAAALDCNIQDLFVITYEKHKID